MSRDAAPSWTLVADESALETVAAKVVESLGAPTPAKPFCLWLQGGLGAGKTTLAGAILRRLGLDPAMPVTSPTYTYVNEYRIGDLWFAHLDLYRAGPQFDLEDLGLTGYRAYSGFLVEWPDQVPANPTLAPTHMLAIEFAESGTTREYKFSF